MTEIVSISTVNGINDIGSKNKISSNGNLETDIKNEEKSDNDDSIVVLGRRDIEINFDIIKEESKFDNLTFNKSWKKIGWVFVAAFPDLVLTVLDKVFDSLEASQYINGDFYTHINVKGEECKYNGTSETYHCGNKTKCEFLDEKEKTYQCFEKDPVYGYMTIFFLFYPGIMSFNFNLMKMMFTKKFNMKLLLIHLLLVPVFPVVLIVQGLISLFHPGNEWSKLSATFTNLEGDFEAMPNLVVVFFVYFNHPDRKPSTFQILQTVEAFISIARSALEGYSVNTQLPWKSKLKILPRFLLTTTFYVGSGTILVTIFRWHFLIILGTYFFLSVLPQIFPRLWSSGLHGVHKEEIKVLNIYIFTMLTVCLTLAGVLVNYFPGITIWNYGYNRQSPLLLENLAAVKNIYTFNVVLVITITSGFLTKIISYIRNARLLRSDISALV